MRLLWIALIPCAAALAGCVSDQGVAGLAALSPTEMVYVRVDGKRLSDHPVLAQLLETDRAICKGEAQKAGLVAPNELESKNLAVQIVSAGMKEGKISDIMQGCMAGHGYTYVTVAEAEARADAHDAIKVKRQRVHTAMN